MITNSYMKIRLKKQDNLLSFVEYGNENKVNKDEYKKAKFELDNFDKIIEARNLKSDIEVLFRVIEINRAEAYFESQELGLLKFVFENEINDDFISEILLLTADNNMFNLFDMEMFYELGDWDFWTKELLDLHFRYGYKEI